MNKEQYNDFKNKKYYRAKELAKHLGIGLSSVWKLSADGRIQAYKLSTRTTVFDINEVNKALFGGEK